MKKVRDRCEEIFYENINEQLLELSHNKHYI